MRRASSFWVVGIVLLGGIVAAAAVVGLAARRRGWQADLDAARKALAEGRHALARQRLADLAERWTHDGEVLLLLGECELARGRRDDALAAWSRIRKESPYHSRAALLRATHLINSGRYGPAERVLMEALEGPVASGTYELERALSRLFRFEGRFEDVREILRRSWCRSDDPAAVLRELWLLDFSPMPVESWGLVLDKADAEDDRVWLGRGRHATMTGRFEEARRWLERCVEKRPADAAVLRAELDLALAADDPTRFWAIAGRIPADRLGPAEVAYLRCWLRRVARDRVGERLELEALARDFPGNIPALERLAAVTLESGRPGEAERLHREKAEADKAKDRFRKVLLDESRLLAHAGELSSLSASLHREFDAAAWSLLARAASDGTGPEPARVRFDGTTAVSETILSSAREISAPTRKAAAGPVPDTAMLADRLADLRPAADSKPGPLAAERDGDPGATASTTAFAFRDDAEAAGLRFLFDNGKTPQFLLPETMSGGLGLIDFDGDGWLDVYCIQGGPLDPGMDSSTTGPGDKLFRNRGDGTFQDVTEAMGLRTLLRGRGYGLGVAVGDYDNDGRPDLFLTRLATYVLLRNRDGRTFEDVTEIAGLSGRRDNPTSAAFADLDNDGDLDLYVCHYMIWDPADPRLCKNEKGEYFYCDPSKVEPSADHAFRNDRGRFVDVTEGAGFVDPGGRGLGVVASDVNADGLVDLFVSNDGTANYLFLNKGGFRFEESALMAGVAGNASGGYQAGMGVAAGDLDGDGRPELLVTNFYGEGTSLYRNLGSDLFADESGASGLGIETRYLLGFGIGLLDAANRGRLDVMITNGHVNDNRPYYPYAMPARLYENRAGPGGFRLVDVSERAGAPFEVRRVGRGLAVGDLDNDGRVDAILLPQNEPVAYLHNVGAAGHFATFRLEGSRSNRDAVGAGLTVIAGDLRRSLERTGGGSFQSASDARLHVGLGRRTRIDRVEVRWPSGRTGHWEGLPADAAYLLREGDQEARPLPGFRAPMPSPGVRAARP
ncbi:FG-GAP-like repeat-containing protein [Aquisphaera insulae]|uniref:FG-GAP-like repeat-containing protein n=1 Tax=Aquisphaera insulae TaxID=2712864 RepID=UPI0013ED89D3|nr:FG-GAP-like repeat-containing protein [Aquisphaera insulae]